MFYVRLDFSIFERERAIPDYPVGDGRRARVLGRFIARDDCEIVGSLRTPCARSRINFAWFLEFMRAGEKFSRCGLL